MFTKIIGLLGLVCVGFGVFVALVATAMPAFAQDSGDAVYTQWKGDVLVITDEQPDYPEVELRLYELATADRPALDPRHPEKNRAAPIRPLRLVHVDIDKWDAPIVDAAHANRIPAELGKAVMLRESGMNPNAQSCCAAGLMQLIPSTAKAMGVRNRFDPVQSINGGFKYLRLMLDRFEGRHNQLELAVAAYNAGPGAVEGAGYKVPNFPETRAYVPKVLEAYRLFLTQRPVPGAEDLRPRPGSPLYPS